MKSKSKKTVTQMSPAVIALIGAFDTKGIEFQFIRDLIEHAGCRTLTINTGILGEPAFKPTISADEVARAGGSTLAELRKKNDRGIAVTTMCRGIAPIISKLHADGKIQGVLGGGGGAGTTVGSAAMAALPIGFPKVIITTGAGLPGGASLKDTTIFPTVVDVSGLNRISRPIFENAAAAIIGMVRGRGRERGRTSDKPIIVASMFGNTTQCVTRAREIFEKAGYEVLVFHAIGTGGQTMEGLIRDGFARGSFDVTTTEWADELVGGILGAGPTRLDAAPQAGIPAIISTGCLDMVNFGAPNTVPEKFKGRKFYQHNPNVTLMRTTPDECAQLGKILAEKINQFATAKSLPTSSLAGETRNPKSETNPKSRIQNPKSNSLLVKVFIPLRGISVISATGQPFHWPEADDALNSNLKKHLRPEISVTELDCNINDPLFAETTAKVLLRMMK